PGGRYARASAVVSSARQLGGVLGVALVVVFIGDLAPETLLSGLRNGWLLSIVAFALVTVLAAPLGRIRPIDEGETTEPRPAVVHSPTPPDDWTVPSAATAATDAPAAGLAALPMFAALPDDALRR